MKYLKQLSYLSFFLILSTTVVSCDNSSGPDEEGNENPATVEGWVANLGSGGPSADTTLTETQPVEGAVIQAARVTADGALEPIGEDSATTDAEGNFTLEIFADNLNDISDRIIIRAEQNGDAATTFVTAPIERGGTAPSQPVGYESTAEADVFRQLTAQGDAGQVTNADIEVAVTEAVARDIETDSSLAAEVAGALVAGEQAKEEFYNNQDVDISDSQREDIREAKTDAQIEYENRLSTTSEQGVGDAYDAFIEEYGNVDLEAEVNPTAAAKANEVASRVLVNQFSAFTDAAQSEVRVESAYLKTYSLEAGVREQLEGLEVSQESLDNLEEAAVTARTSIRDLEGQASAEDIRQIFMDFGDVVVAAIENEDNLNSAAFLGVTATINEPGGAKATLESALEGNSDVLSVMDAYNRYYSDVEATVNDAFDPGPAAYFTQLAIMINAPV